MTLRVAILDDYQAVALQLADWASLGHDVTVSVFNAPFADEAAAATALAEFDILCLMRERLALPARTAPMRSAFGRSASQTCSAWRTSFRSI